VPARYLCILLVLICSSVMVLTWRPGGGESLFHSAFISFFLLEISRIDAPIYYIWVSSTFLGFTFRFPTHHYWHSAAFSFTILNFLCSTTFWASLVSSFPVHMHKTVHSLVHSRCVPAPALLRSYVNYILIFCGGVSAGYVGRCVCLLVCSLFSLHTTLSVSLSSIFVLISCLPLFCVAVMLIAGRSLGLCTFSLSHLPLSVLPAMTGIFACLEQVSGYMRSVSCVCSLIFTAFPHG